MNSVKIHLILFFICISALYSCSNLVKNENPSIDVEEGTKTTYTTAIETKKEQPILGKYVGMFEADIDDSTKWANVITAGEAFYWTRENKIALCIDSIQGNFIIGHSVVAGNERPFKGSITKKENYYTVEVKEPGNEKNDGIFNFFIRDSLVEGTWKAFAKIEISNRKYTLIKKDFKYNPNQQLDINYRFVDWTKPALSKSDLKKLKAKMTPEEIAEYEEFNENTNFASATKIIYTVNASSTLLTEKQVANLSKGDLSIIRNTIYARHGYSFKNRPLRVFFDRQSWYIPVYTDITNDFTELEKKNIQLLLKYEKIAKEFYDYFGRG